MALSGYVSYLQYHRHVKLFKIFYNLSEDKFVRFFGIYFALFVLKLTILLRNWVVIVSKQKWFWLLVLDFDWTMWSVSHFHRWLVLNGDNVPCLPYEYLKYSVFSLSSLNISASSPGSSGITRLMRPLIMRFYILHFF